MIFHQHSSGILILVVRMGGLRYLLRLRLHEPTVHDQQVQMYDWSAEDRNTKPTCHYMAKYNCIDTFVLQVAQ